MICESMLSVNQVVLLLLLLIGRSRNFLRIKLFLFGVGVKDIRAPRPPPIFCLQTPQFPTSACSVPLSQPRSHLGTRLPLSMLFTHSFGSQLFLINCKDPVLWRLLMENYLTKLN
jgi:hypothetical protein